MQIKYRSQLGELMEHFGLKGSAAELGCAEGYFSADLLRMPQIELLYMVDNWATIPTQTGDGGFDQGWHDRNFKAATERVNSIAKPCIVLRGLTTEGAKAVPDSFLSLLYIDAGHSYECVMADLQAWYSKVKTGGIIAGHDYLNPSYGVKQAVADFCASKGITEINIIPENQECDSGFWFRKI